MNRLITIMVLMMAALALFAMQVFAGQYVAGEPVKHEKRVTIRGKHEDKKAIESLADESEGDVEIDTGPKTIISINGRFKIDRSKPVEEAAVDFIDRHRNAFGLRNPKAELRLRDDKPSKNMSFQQTYNGVPVWSHSIGVHLNEDDEINLIVGNSVPTPDIDTTPSITAEQAIEIARADVTASKGGKIVGPLTDLWIYKNELAYEVGFIYRSRSWRYFIEANTGKILIKGDTTSVD